MNYIKKFAPLILSFCLSREFCEKEDPLCVFLVERSFKFILLFDSTCTDLNIFPLKSQNKIKCVNIRDFNVKRKETSDDFHLTPVKCCVKYLFTIFYDHLAPEKAFSIFRLYILRLKLFALMFYVRYFHLTLKTIQQNKVNFERLVFISVRVSEYLLQSFIVSF